MSPVDIGKLISNDIAREEKSEEAKGRHLNSYDYLKHRGYGNQEETNSLLQFHANYQAGIFKRFEDKQMAPADDKAIQERITRFRTVDPEGQRRQVEVGEEAAQAAANRPGLILDRLRRSAFNKLLAERKVTGTYEGALQEKTGLTLGSVHREIATMLKGAALDRGVKVDVSDRYKLTDSDAAWADQYEKALDDIQAAGGDPIGDEQRITSRLSQAELQRQVDRQKRAGDAQVNRKPGLIARMAGGGARAVQAGPGVLPGPGMMPILPRPGIMAPVAPLAGDADRALLGAVNQLIALTQKTLEVQQGQDQKLAEANRQLGQAKPQAVPPPLPVQGPGRIPTR